MKVLLSVDDATKDDIKLANLCSKYGIEAVFFFPVDYLTLCMEKGWEPISPEAEQEIAQNFEIGSHGVTHAYLTQIPLEAARYEIVESKKILEAKYNKKITKFCYPRGYSNYYIQEIVKEAGYEYARSTAIGHIGNPVSPLFATTSVHMGCPVRPEYKGTTWIDYGRKLLNKARENDELFHAWCHSWEITKYNEWGNVEKFLKEMGT